LIINKYVDLDTNFANHTYFHLPESKEIYKSNTNIFQRSPFIDGVRLDVKIQEGKEFIFNTDIYGSGLYTVVVSLIEGGREINIKKLNMIVSGKYTISEMLMPKRQLTSKLRINLVSVHTGAFLSKAKDKYINKIEVYKKTKDSYLSLLSN